MIEVGKIYFCRSIEDAKAFLEECDKQDIVWNYKKQKVKASGEINFEYQNGTCYYPEKWDWCDNVVLSISSLDFAQINYGKNNVIVYTRPSPEEEIKAIDESWKKLMQIK